MLERIAAAACPDPAGTVLEIGPGRGALTRHLLPHAARVIAVEVDPKMVESLARNLGMEERLTVVPGDVLTTDLTQWGPVAVAGNLPYYITSPIIERVLSMGPVIMQQAVFLVQREVAERIATGPGSRDYGYLSVLVQTFASASLLFTVPPGAFEPPPNVDSAVIRLIPRAQPLVDDPSSFLTFVGRCFHLKRKTLRNNLRPFYSAGEIDALPEAGERAEQLPPEQFASLFARLGRPGHAVR